MTVRLYDSRAAAVVDLVPLVDGQVSMYVCGPTVQSSPHIGHLRSALVYDVWRRWLTYRGYRTDVTVPWKDVRGAEIQERGPAGVRIDLRGARRKDPVVPITAFTVPAEQLVEEIARARSSMRR